MRLADIAPVIGAHVFRDGAFQNLGFSVHDGPGLLTWLESRKYLAGIRRNEGINAVIAHPDVASALPDRLGILTHAKPRDALFRLHNYLARETAFYGVHAETLIHADARISLRAHVDDLGVVIGEHTVVEPGATILAGTRIGARCVIRAGVVLGSQGFQFARMDGVWVGIDHAGGVLIDDDVEIQSNTNVARAIFRGNTEIGQNTKIDAMVHIAHNVKIGHRVLLCAGVVIGGSTVIGDDVYMGPGATVLNCIRIGAKARITMGSVVVRSLPEGRHVSGNWAIPHDEFLRSYGKFMATEEGGRA